MLHRRIRMHVLLDVFGRLPRHGSDLGPRLGKPGHVEWLTETEADLIADGPRNGCEYRTRIAKVQQGLCVRLNIDVALDRRAHRRDVAQSHGPALVIVMKHAGPDKRVTTLAAVFARITHH